MTTNLLTLVQNALGSEFANLTGEYLGESTASTQSALSSLLPVLLGSIAQKSQTSDGLAQLSSLVNSSDLDTGILDNPGGLFGSDGSGVSKLIKLGLATLVPALLGDKAGGLASALAGTTGISGKSSTSLIALAVPLLLTFLKKYVKQNNLSAGSLATQLQGQGEYLSDKLDKRLLEALGYASPAVFLGLGKTASSGARAATNAAAAAAPPAKSGLMRWLPLAILAAVALALWNMFSGKPQEPAPTPPAAQAPATTTAPAQESTTSTAPAQEPATTMAPAQESTMATAPATESAAPAAPAMEAAFPYKMYFDTGSAVLGAEASTTLKDAAEVISKNDLKVAITGYTDKVGDVTSNEALAKNRALAVRDALMAAGVAEASIEMNPPMFVETGTSGGEDPEARRVEVTEQ